MAAVPSHLWVFSVSSTVPNHRPMMVLMEAPPIVANNPWKISSALPLSKGVHHREVFQWQRVMPQLAGITSGSR